MGMIFFALLTVILYGTARHTGNGVFAVLAMVSFVYLLLSGWMRYERVNAVEHPRD